MLSIDDHFAREDVELLTLFRNIGARRVLREGLGYDLRRRDGSFMDRSIMRTLRLESWMVAVVSCLVEEENRGLH